MYLETLVQPPGINESGDRMIALHFDTNLTEDLSSAYLMILNLATGFP